VAAVEVMLNTKHVAELIKKGSIDEIKEAMEQSLSPGSETFEQSLFKLFSKGLISKEEALRNSDSASNLAWLMDNAGLSKARDASPANVFGMPSASAAPAATPVFATTPRPEVFSPSIALDRLDMS
jgi:hypothetical protein